MLRGGAADEEALSCLTAVSADEAPVLLCSSEASVSSG